MYTIDKPERGDNDYDVCFTKDYFEHAVTKIIKEK